MISQEVWNVIVIVFLTLSLAFIIAMGVSTAMHIFKMNNTERIQEESRKKLKNALHMARFKE